MTQAYARRARSFSHDQYFFPASTFIPNRQLKTILLLFIDILSFSHLVIPYNVTRSHWILLHIDNGAKKVFCYDSYGGQFNRETSALV